MKQGDSFSFDSQKAFKWGLHWFRRDLRVAGNAALEWNRKQNNGRVVGVFCFDSQFLSRPDFSHNRFAFFINTLVALKNELQSIGSDLLVLDQGPEQGFQLLFDTLKKYSLSLPQTLSVNRDYEPYARIRDEKIEKIITHAGVAFHTERDHLLLEPHEVLKPDSEKFYQIFTPYSKRWFEKLKTHEVQDRVRAQKVGLQYLEDRIQGKIEKNFHLTWEKVFSGHVPLADHLDSFKAENEKHVSISIPKAGSEAAYKKLIEFKNKIHHYATARDIPSIHGTSQFSIYLKNGSLTSSQIIQAFNLQNLEWKEDSSQNKFLKEIVWREFYYCILFHRPDLEMNPFQLQFKDLPWENRQDYFEAWKEGKTGYPIVDAGMRQLKKTGWMHNRVRMIVASFLTKDLLIDWRWGEKYFMELLLDGDLAPNNGGWQWAASTGCDAQPYFRIFNPTLQSQRFDPEGAYIRHYVPELKSLSNKEIHIPRNPIVNHAIQKEKVLAMYKKIAKKISI